MDESEEVGGPSVAPLGVPSGCPARAPLPSLLDLALSQGLIPLAPPRLRDCRSATGSSRWPSRGLPDGRTATDSDSRAGASTRAWEPREADIKTGTVLVLKLQHDRHSSTLTQSLVDLGAELQVGRFGRKVVRVSAT